MLNFLGQIDDSYLISQWLPSDAPGNDVDSRGSFNRWPNFSGSVETQAFQVVSGLSLLLYYFILFFSALVLHSYWHVANPGLRVLYPPVVPIPLHLDCIHHRIHFRLVQGLCWPHFRNYSKVPFFYAYSRNKAMFSFRMVYKWFLLLHKMSYVLGIAGYFTMMFALMGLNFVFGLKQTTVMDAGGDSFHSSSQGIVSFIVK